MCPERLMLEGEGVEGREVGVWEVLGGGGEGNVGMEGRGGGGSASALTGSW